MDFVDQLCEDGPVIFRERLCVDAMNTMLVCVMLDPPFHRVYEEHGQHHFTDRLCRLQ